MSPLKIAILNGSGNLDYLFGLVSGLSKQPHLQIEVIASEEGAEMLGAFGNVILRDIVGNARSDLTLPQKIRRTVRCYRNLVDYTLRSDATLFHIQWLNKFEVFDRIILIPLYRAVGKRVVLTAHNIDQMERAGCSSITNSATLWLMYRLVDHIIVHTDACREELVSRFNVNPAKISLVRHGINNKLEMHGLSLSVARNSLGISDRDLILLFFGNVERYKGTDYLIESVAHLRTQYTNLRLIIAGRVKDRAYQRQLDDRILALGLDSSVDRRFRFIPEPEVELLFTASDCVVLPYRRIFQSGVVFMAYRFGLPMVASRVGGLSEDIVEGQTGVLCEPDNVQALSAAIERLLEGPLGYRDRRGVRQRIRDYGHEHYSWSSLGHQTAEVYEKTIRRPTVSARGEQGCEALSPRPIRLALKRLILRRLVRCPIPASLDQRHPRALQQVTVAVPFRAPRPTVVAISIDDLCPVPRTRCGIDYGGDLYDGLSLELRSLLEQYPHVGLTIFLIPSMCVSKRSRQPTSRYAVSRPEFKDWCSFYTGLAQKSNVEYGLHGMYHLQWRNPFFSRHVEFAFTTEAESSALIGEGLRIARTAGFDVVGFRQPGWDINADLSLLRSIRAAGMIYLAGSSRNAGLNARRTNVSNEFPTLIDGVLNIPQNIELDSSLESTYTNIARIYETGGIISIKGHMADTSTIANSLCVGNIAKLRAILEHLETNYADRTAYRTFRQIAQLALASLGPHDVVV